jgi:hypothetical protein
MIFHLALCIKRNTNAILSALALLPQKYVHTCLYTDIHIHHKKAFSHTHTHTHTHTYTHAHTHTHIPKQFHTRLHACLQLITLERHERIIELCALNLKKTIPQSLKHETQVGVSIFLFGVNVSHCTCKYV